MQLNEKTSKSFGEEKLILSSHWGKISCRVHNLHSKYRSKPSPAEIQGSEVCTVTQLKLFFKNIIAILGTALVTYEYFLPMCAVLLAIYHFKVLLYVLWITFHEAHTSGTVQKYVHIFFYFLYVSLVLFSRNKRVMQSSVFMELDCN